MIYVDGRKDAIHPDYAQQIKREIGDVRYIQSPIELLSKLQTRDEKELIVGPFMGTVEFSDTFYGTILRSEKEGDPYIGQIIGIDFNRSKPTADNHKVTYYESADTKPDGSLYNFKPGYFVVGGTNRPNTYMFDHRSWEMFWFLNTICRKVKNSLNAHANTSKDFTFEITRPELQATEKRTAGSLRRRAEFLVWEESANGGFTPEQLTNIGRYLQLPLKNYRNTDQLRDAIWAAATHDESARQLSGDPTIKGYQYIILLGDKKGPDQELRELVTTAIESGVIEHNMERKHWVLKKDGNIISNFCPVDDLAPIKINALISFLKLDIESKERLESMVPKANMEGKLEEIEPEKKTSKKATVKE